MFCSKNKRLKTKTKHEEKRGTLTPELVVVAAALRLATAVSRLADVALVVHAVTVQEALRETSGGGECILNISTFKAVKHLETLHQPKQKKLSGSAAA